MKSQLQRFEHYELVTAKTGNRLNWGRGAMGSTFKAFDINLHPASNIESHQRAITSVTNQRDFVAQGCGERPSP